MVYEQNSTIHNYDWARMAYCTKLHNDYLHLNFTSHLILFLYYVALDGGHVWVRWCKILKNNNGQNICSS